MGYWLGPSLAGQLLCGTLQARSNCWLLHTLSIVSDSLLTQDRDRPRATEMAERPQTSSTHVTETSHTSSIPAEHKWTPYSGPVLFTGPSGLRDYRSNQQPFQQMVGVGERSAEFTSDLAYLSRPPPGTSFPLAKNGRIGEIGWPVEHFKIVKGI
ncbi:uncharacterized protein LOC101855712 [Aplysia californica]|uniref:Uncharacterized protein LOC101855712 n=1 Tax=Aplysia californica TaxID=6500 RepID=A0ABM0JJ87_APLCA|nr:uncharacterized protein LOC101855712 [Aplysia californica]